MWLGVVASVVATIYAGYWDLCVDWGLLNRHSKNKWLRDKIITRNKSVYFVAIVSPLTSYPCGDQMHCLEKRLHHFQFRYHWGTVPCFLQFPHTQLNLKPCFCHAGCGYCVEVSVDAVNYAS